MKDEWIEITRSCENCKYLKLVYAEHDTGYKEYVCALTKYPLSDNDTCILEFKYKIDFS